MRNIMGKVTNYVNKKFDDILAKLDLIDQYYDEEDDDDEERYISYKDELFYYKFYKNIMTKQIKENNANDINENTLKLMSLNMAEIREFYSLSKAMAKKSFVLAVTMCVLGFGIILLTIFALFFTDITFMESIVPVIGGSVVEVIAGTSLIVYKKSLEQLNQYYEALHNNERYLSLVNLVDKLTDDKKDETYINIINSQLDKLK